MVNGYTCPPQGFASCADKNGTTGDPNCAHCRATVADRSDLRALIREAIGTEWHRRIAEQIADTPDGHIDALTNAVIERMSDFSRQAPWPDSPPCPFSLSPGVTGGDLA
jgi:hypothetical protein